jgi:hypothetical protein
MIPHLKRSRILKALTDRHEGGVSYDDAEARLAKSRVAIVLGASQAATAAGQAAAVTAAVTACKCFGRAALVADPATELLRPLRAGATLGVVAKAIGARMVPVVPDSATHVIAIGCDAATTRPFVHCWWDGWTAGILPGLDQRAPGISGNPLSGTFAGALAIREVFAMVLGRPRAGRRVSIASLWTPWRDPIMAQAGPAEVYLPRQLWFIGLGHLGQGFLWNLAFLPVTGGTAVLQDDQTAGEENESTGLVTRAGDIGRRKTRIAAEWLEAAGWSTSLIERRHHGDIPLHEQDPAIVVTGLDDVVPRLGIARAGFSYMVDAGVGHGPVDFESLQLRVLAKGNEPEALWSKQAKPKDVDALLERDTYRAYEAKYDRCGALTLAEASVAVPFVGAATGALAIGQVIRLASMLETASIIQMQLGSPHMVVEGRMNSAPRESVGSMKLRIG